MPAVQINFGTGQIKPLRFGAIFFERPRFSNSHHLTIDASVHTGPTPLSIQREGLGRAAKKDIEVSCLLP
jgi:hypothetical protein